MRKIAVSIQTSGKSRITRIKLSFVSLLTAPVTCKPSEFTCLNGICIDVQFICNGEDDCGDDSDEKHCTVLPRKTVTCQDGEFKCASQQIVCISESQR